MGSFSVRVELHDAKDYAELHKHMKAEGFLREIALNKILYHLPTGEYNLVGVFTIEQVMEKVRRASVKTTKKYEFLVIESKKRRGFQLKLVVPKK